jgi:hypothetical protein
VGAAGSAPPERPHPVVSAIAIAALLGAAWAVIRVAGAQPETADLMYIPILTAAWYFGVPGGVVAGMAAGALAGPLARGSVDVGDALGAAIYVFIGVVAGFGSTLLLRRLNNLEEMSEQLERAYANALAGIATALELRDADTAGHSSRMAVNAKAVGEALGLDAVDLSILYWAGILHDVGKIGVPEAILHKAGLFTAEERHIMDSHASVGADLIVTASPDLAPVAALVRQHHERWDGRGYPDQLAGDEVSLGGRILHVVDVFDAISSPRPYRRPLSPREAMDYLNDHMGTEFDPLVVDVFAAEFAAARIVHADPGDTTAKGCSRPDLAWIDRRGPLRNAETARSQETGRR